MRRIAKIGDAIDSVSEWTGRIVSFFIFVIVAIVIIEVVARYFFSRPTLWAWDINIMWFAGMAFLGGSYHLLHHEYIVVDIVYSRFPRKLKLIADSIGFLGGLLFLAVVVWHGSNFAWLSLEVKETFITGSHLPIYHVKIALPIGAFLMLLQWVTLFIRDFTAGLAGREAVHLRPDGWEDQVGA